MEQPRYKMRKRKSSVDYTEQNMNLEMVEPDLCPPTRKKSNSGSRKASGRGGKAKANPEAPVQDMMVDNQTEVHKDHGQGLNAFDKSVGSVAKIPTEEPTSCSSSATDYNAGLNASGNFFGSLAKILVEQPPCSSKADSIEVLLDTPPSSVHELAGIDRMEEDIPFTKQDNPTYFEQNKNLYKLYRERLDRQGMIDPYHAFKNGAKSSDEPWGGR